MVVFLEHKLLDINTPLVQQLTTHECMWLDDNTQSTGEIWYYIATILEQGKIACTSIQEPI